MNSNQSKGTPYFASDSSKIILDSNALQPNQMNTHHYFDNESLSVGGSESDLRSFHSSGESQLHHLISQMDYLSDNGCQSQSNGEDDSSTPQSTSDLDNGCQSQSNGDDDSSKTESTGDLDLKSNNGLKSTAIHGSSNSGNLSVFDSRSHDFHSKGSRASDQIRFNANAFLRNDMNSGNLSIDSRRLDFHPNGSRDSDRIRLNATTFSRNDDVGDTSSSNQSGFETAPFLLGTKRPSSAIECLVEEPKPKKAKMSHHPSNPNHNSQDAQSRSFCDTSMITDKTSQNSCNESATFTLLTNAGGIPVQTLCGGDKSLLRENDHESIVSTCMDISSSTGKSTPKKPKTNHPTLQYGGYQYTFAYRTKDYDVYKCTYFRRKHCYCPVKVKVYHSDKRIELFTTADKGGIIPQVEHVEYCKSINTINRSIINDGELDPNADRVILNPVKVTGEVNNMVDELAHKDWFKTSTKEVASKIMNTMSEKYPNGWTGTTRKRIEDKVRNIRHQLKGSDVWRTIESTLVRMANENDSFLQFNHTCPHPTDPTKLHRIVGFAHPFLLKKLKGIIHLFTDGTFKCAPHPFKQVMIIMVWCPHVGIYVPVMWILMTGQTQDLYMKAFQFLKWSTGDKLNPISVTCDFEQALMNAVEDLFVKNHNLLLKQNLDKILAEHDDTRIKSKVDDLFKSISRTKRNGCLFHLKQACRKYMKEHRIPEEQMKYAMGRDVFDLLTIIPPGELKSKGLPFIREMIEQKFDLTFEEIRAWDSFWSYFERYWLKPARVAAWNLVGEDGEMKEIRAKVNNGSERYNRTMNERFPTHPSLLDFVEGIKEESNIQIKRIKNIEDGVETSPDYEKVFIPKLPDEYMDFIPKNRDEIEEEALRILGQS